jgi:hypothetical protein
MARVSAVERLESRLADLKERQEKLLQRKKLIEASRGAAERKKARKAENSRKFEFGGLVKAAGLFDWDKGQFTGALLSLLNVAADEETSSKWKKHGDAFLAMREQNKNRSTNNGERTVFDHNYEALP